MAAVIREFKEELGITVKINGAPVFMENIYTHEDQIGHEILAVFNVIFPLVASRETRMAFTEDDGNTWFAEWFAVEALDMPVGLNCIPKNSRHSSLDSSQSLCPPLTTFELIARSLGAEFEF